MAASDSEKYLRYLLLLGEGGLLVLRGIVLKEASKRRQSLHAILENNRAMLSSKISNQQQCRHIFPTASSVDADLSTWDINLLGIVIIHVFGNTLDQREVNGVKEIHDSRVDISENESCMCLVEMEYRKKRLQLSLTLLNLAAETDFNTHYMCLEIISTSGAAPYSIHALLQKLADLREFQSEMIETLYTQLDMVIKEEDCMNADSSNERDSDGNIFTHTLGERMTALHTERWYFGPLTREETNEIFDHVDTDGIFLIRDCQSNPGNLVLSVKEAGKVSQYFIRREPVDGHIKFHIGEGDKSYDSVADIVDFYSTHYLNKTTLTKPATRQKFVTKSDFEGNNPKDLSFKKGDILEIISKEEDRWWYARDSDGRIGIVPVLYLTHLQDGEASGQKEKPAVAPKPRKETARDASPPLSVPKRLPSKAIVTKTRISNPYDETQLTLHKGDIVVVTKMFANGQWLGECRGKTGMFPFRRVTFLDDM
ncbi:adapter molecule Crk-like isoform X1 [Mercenaria mercenaria]|uniref:adapter molecule Crk-like isoform X1 n=1 Tax=Mercenaria mercenaria TaxID=6596 RepID=UPI00234E9BE2|nr:adapter molecule Crk-like isoform X1 [Mercenaria mercenaria]XP_053382258.1 adapter molecule Crk-like isoform X1 [Mercenaria mercenaria]